MRSLTGAVLRWHDQHLREHCPARCIRLSFVTRLSYGSTWQFIVIVQQAFKLCNIMMRLEWMLLGGVSSSVCDPVAQRMSNAA